MNSLSTPTPSLLSPNSKHTPTPWQSANPSPRGLMLPTESHNYTVLLEGRGETNCGYAHECLGVTAHPAKSTGSCHITTAMTSLMKEAGEKCLLGTLSHNTSQTKGRVITDASTNIVVQEPYFFIKRVLYSQVHHNKHMTGPLQTTGVA